MNEDISLNFLKSEKALRLGLGYWKNINNPDPVAKNIYVAALDTLIKTQDSLWFYERNLHYHHCNCINLSISKAGEFKLINNSTISKPAMCCIMPNPSSIKDGLSIEDNISGIAL